MKTAFAGGMNPIRFIQSFSQFRGFFNRSRRLVGGNVFP
jgi:hypothetical protein